MRVNTKFTMVALSLLSTLVVGLGIQANADTVDRGRDCDNFAVIRCGTHSAQELRAEYDTLGAQTKMGNNSSTRQSDIPAIFTALGISRGALDGDYVKGIVYKDGTVRVNDKIVARNAQTAIRGVSGTSISGSSNAKIVPTSKMGSAQEALVRLNAKGQFVFAIMTPCGNPVRATNVVPEPVYSCDSLVAKADAKNLYRQNFTINGTAKNGATVYDYVINYGDGTPTAISKTNSFAHTYTNPGTYKVKSSIRFTINGKVELKTGSQCETTVTIKKPEVPVASCDSLVAKADAKDIYLYSFTVKGSAKGGATVYDYVINYGDGTPSVNTKSNAFTHKYTKPGVYTVKSSIRFTINGKVELKTGSQCETKVTIKKPEVVLPVYSCTSLTATPKMLEVNKAVQFSTAIEAKDGATIKDYAYDFGDGTKTTLTSSTTSHTYKKAGTYTATVVPSFMVNGKVVTSVKDACRQTIVVKDIPVKETPAVNIEKTVNSQEYISVDENEPFTYELTVTNTGNVDLKNVKVTDTPQKGIILQSVVDGKGKITNNTWSYTIPELKQKQSLSFKLVAVVPEYIPGKIVNNACVDAVEVPGSPDDCDEAVVELKVKACNIETGVIEKVKPGEQNIPPYTTDLSKCEKVTVCDTTTKTIVVITKKEAEDTERYVDQDSDKCKDTPPPVVPPTPETPESPEYLPETGISDTISAGLAFGAIVTATTAYVASRRNLLG